MVDLRFYLSRGPVPASLLAQGLQAGEAVGDASVGPVEIIGDGARLLGGIAPAHLAGPGDLAWVEGKVRDISPSVGALFISADQRGQAPQNAVALVTRFPRAAFARASALLFGARSFQSDAAIDSSAEIEEGALLAPGVVIGPGARIGAGAVIGPHVSIGPGVTVGRRTRIGAGASLQCALVGDDVTVLPGARIGQQGFGIAVGPRGPVEIPHFGRVVIMDRALIGAGVTIDRGLFDDTTIGEDAKIDNLCQIAHNVTIGRAVIVAACAGVSGSTSVGDGAVLAGRVGVADHRHIGAGATLAAGSAVMHDVPAGETWGGYPAKPIRKWLREVAWLQRASIGRRDDGG